MKNLIIILIVSSSFFSCSISSRAVKKDRGGFKIQDNSVVETKKPGDIIVFNAPKIPKNRPKDTTITYHGKKGAKAITNYDEEGFVSSQIINCPEEEETKRLNITSELEYRIKESERKANIELVNAIGKWLSVIMIPIGFFFAAAFVIRGYIR